MSQSTTANLVCIFGVGAQTPIGRSAPACAASVRAGVTRAHEHETWKDDDAEPAVVHRARYLPDSLSGAERLLALAGDAALEALSPLLPEPGAQTSPDTGPLHLGVYVGMPELRPGLTASVLEAFQRGLSEAISQRLSTVISPRLELSHVTLLPHGHASGVEALEQARQALASGYEQVCLVGGVDSYLHPDTIAWLVQHEQLHGVNNAWGLAPGEGAGFCLVGLERLAVGRKLPVLARVRATAVTQEPNRIKTQTVCTGEGLTQGFQSVLPLLSGEKVDQLVIDLNGEIYRSEELGFASVRSQQYFVSMRHLLAPSSAWGDVGAASAPLYMTLAVQAQARGWSRGPRWLISTSSEGGLRGVMLLELGV